MNRSMLRLTLDAFGDAGVHGHIVPLMLLGVALWGSPPLVDFWKAHSSQGMSAKVDRPLPSSAFDM